MFFLFHGSFFFILELILKMSIHINGVEINGSKKFSLTDTVIIDLPWYKKLLLKQKQKRELKEKTVLVGFLRLFRYSTSIDKLFMIIGSLGAILNGSSIPLIILVWSNVVESFSSYEKNCKYLHLIDLKVF